ncbi:MAG: LacI family DNA-binding transcriptional regulator [Beutenbergiaceae bacterium]
MARIRDVAEHAGVSTATVSRVLNGKTVRPDLAEAVWKSVQEMSYSPNRTARSLRRRSSDVVALIIPDVENPFFTSVARGVEDVCRKAGYSVVLCNTDDDAEQERKYVKIAADENMVGLIIAPATADVSLDSFERDGRGVVVLDRHVKADVDQITFDNVALGRQAARRLVDRGFTSIACITGPERVETARARADGWREVLDRAGLVSEGRLRYANFHVHGGREALAELLDGDDPPEAVVATNNLLGVGVLQVVAERGLSGRVGVAVIGDLPFATSRPDDVDLVGLNPRDMGLSAAQMMLERIAGDDKPARVHTLVQGKPVAQ